jgi:ribonucleoside-diphosphate reductase beta chain
MSSLFTHDQRIFKQGNNGFDYPVFNEFYEAAVASPWRHQEVNMAADELNWELNTTEQERKVIAGVLKGFVSSEIGIGCYWRDVVAKLFAKPEIRDMAVAFSYFETIHARAYSYLNDCLGLNEYEEFISDPIACKKVESFFTQHSPAVSLAVFSGAGEGVSLFSSFAVLLSFCNDNGRFGGLRQIISWSAEDEQLHADGGSMLFKELVKEQGISDEELEQIYEGFRLIVDREHLFIDSNFDNLKIPSIDPEELKAYILLRANERLEILGLKPIFVLTQDEKDKALSLSAWFEPMIIGTRSTDAFAHQKSGGNYVAKPPQNYEEVIMSNMIFDDEIFSRV